MVFLKRAKGEVMEENILKEYKYKTDKVERYFTLAIFIIFFFSFVNSSGFAVFGVFTIIVLVYYFKFYMKKPLYLRILGDELTVSQGFFFKLKTFGVNEINLVNKLENRIELILIQGEKIVLFKILLSESDYIEIYEKLKKRPEENLNQ